MTEKKKERSKIKTFDIQVPFKEVKENYDNSRNTQSKPSKEEIINAAFQAHSIGNIKEAAKYYQYFLNQGFKDHRVFSNFGMILQILGKSKEAEFLTRKAIEIDPNYANAHTNLGNILRDIGKLKEAEVSQLKAIKINPNYANAYSNLGVLMRDLGDLKGAEIATKKAIELKPNYAEAYYNLGTILIEFGNLQDAELSLRKAIEIKPNYAKAYSNLGTVLRHFGKLDEAKKIFEKCLEIKPNDSDNISNLIQVLTRLYCWDEIEKYLPYLKVLGLEGKGINPMNFMYLEDNPEHHLKRAIKFSNAKRREKLPSLNTTSKNEINIAYFSSDFNDHPVSISLIRVLELHDKSKFKVFIYSLSKINDDYTQRIKDAAYCFRELHSLSDFEIVKLVRNDNIDIAIDLNGYTKNNRISIFHYRVAPIQINYLGYPGTTGSKSFDYILADKVLIPEESKKFYTEKVLYLPNSCVPYDDTKYISRNKFRRVDLDLPSEGFIFTCFNDIRKITKKEFEIWINLLKRVEMSVLWLIKPNDTAMKNIISEVTSHGIEQKRLIFARKMKLDAHLSRHYCGDLYLDTFNFNAATTAKIALSSGLPVITLRGKSYSSRMASSILSACELNELIADNYSEYEELAYELAINKKKINDLRKKINNKLNCSFFDSYEFTQKLESVYTNLLND